MELKARGVTVGESMGLSIELPQGPLNLNETYEIVLRAMPASKAAGPVLWSGPAEGLTIQGGDIVPVRTGDDGGLEYRVPVTFVGESGPTLLKVFIKGEEYSATLAFAQTSLRLRPTKMEMELQGAPLVWMKSGPLRMKVMLRSPPNVREKGDLTYALRLQDGTRLRFDDEGPIRFSVKGGGEVPIEIPPILSLAEGPLSLELSIGMDGEVQSKTVPEAIVVIDEGNVDAILPERWRIDLPIPLELHIKGLQTDRSSVELRANGTETPILPDTSVREPSSDTISFRLPDLEKGPHILHILYRGTRLCSRNVHLDERPPFILKRLDCLPRDVQPGGKVRVNMDFELNRDLFGLVRGVLRIDGAAGQDVQIDLTDRKGHYERSLQIGPSVKEGDHALEVEVFRGEELLFHEVRTGSLRVRGESALDLMIRTPLDLALVLREPSVGHLLPGETLAGRERSGDLEVLRSSTGRHLLIFKGDLVLSCNFPKEREPSAKRAFIAHTFQRSFFDPSFSKSVLKAIDRQDSVLSLCSQCGRRSGGEKGPPGRNEGLPKGGRPSEGRSFSEEYLPFLRTLDSKGDMERRIKEKPSYSKDFEDIWEGIGGLFSPSSLDDKGRDPARSLRGAVDRIAGSLRSRKAPADANRMKEALHTALCRTRTALEQELSISEPGKATSVSVEGLVRTLLFHMIAAHLLRLEILGSWTDPAVGAWEELRIERQRALKSETNQLFDLLSRISDIHRTAKDRYGAYSRNMVLRSSIEAFKGLKVEMGRSPLSGIGGETWSGRIVMSQSAIGSEMEVRPYIRLPGPGWQLLSPGSTAEGAFLALETVKVPQGGTASLEIRILTPQSAPKSSTALLYLTVGPRRLEVEP